ncbi:AAA family ATPase [Salisaeta longa]|uniref:phosphonate transporter n=1 Tax=Salisaeta longa TaxID=503170 RepID=UPI0003B45D7B|nr:phosphonate transporter [Salisaeta longa]
MATSTSSPPAEWYEAQWTALCNVLGTDDPSEVVPRVRTLHEQMQRLDEQNSRGEGLVTVSEVEDVFQQMNQRLERLRDRNRTLVEQLEHGGGADRKEAVFRALHDETEALLDALGVASIDEARNRVQSLTNHLERLYREKEKLVNAGYESVDALLDDLHKAEVRAEKYKKLKREKQKLKQTKRTATGSIRPDTAVLQAATALRRVLGIDTVGEAQAVVHTLESIEQQLRKLLPADAAPEDMPSDAGEAENARKAPDLITRIEAYATALHESDPVRVLPKKLRNLLGIESVPDAQQLADMIRGMAEEIDTLKEQHAALDATGFEVPEIIDHLQALRGARSPADRHLPATEAASMRLLINTLETQLDALQDQQRILIEHGLQNAETAVQRVEQLEHDRKQLAEHLAQVMETLQAPPPPPTDPAPPADPAPTPHRTPPVVPSDVLARLDADGCDVVNDLTVGAFCLDDAGVVQCANAMALEVPGITASDPASVVGKPFFDALAPAARTPLFYGRFATGVAQEALDTAFLYTFTAAGYTPRAFAVHMYRASTGTWLLLRPLTAP